MKNKLTRSNILTLSLLALILAEIFTGCGETLDEEKDTTVYDIKLIEKFVEEVTPGHFKIKDNSTIYLEGKNLELDVKTLEFGKNVSLHGGFKEETACETNGKDSGSIDIKAEKIIGNPQVELLGQSAKYCTEQLEDDKYLDFLNASPLNAGKSGFLTISETSDLEEFSPSLSEAFSKGSDEVWLKYKKRNRRVASGSDSTLTRLCYFEDYDCKQSSSDLVQQEGPQEESLVTVSNPLGLSKNHRIIADKVIFKASNIHKLGHFSLLVEAKSIIFEDGVSFIGHLPKFKLTCGRSGANSGNLFLMSPNIVGGFSANLKGTNASRVCATSKRFSHCKSNGDDVKAQLSRAKALNGGNSGSLYLLKSDSPFHNPKIKFSSSQATGSKAYEFKAWANHHWGTFGANSCGWNRKKKVKAGAKGKSGKINYLTEGPNWN